MTADRTEHFLARGDTSPALKATLYNADGTVHDASDADSVTVHIYLSNGKVLKLTGAWISDGSDGRITYQWLPADWTGDPGLIVGRHRMKYEVERSGSNKATFPNKGHHVLVIEDDIADS